MSHSRASLFLLQTVALTAALALPVAARSAAPAIAAAAAPDTRTGAPADAATLDARFASFDRDYDALRNLVSNAATDTQPLSRDGRGRTIDDDIHDWVLGEDAQSHIDALRREAELADRSGNRDGAQQDLGQAEQILLAEVQRLLAIRLYWRMNQMLDAHRELWGRLLDEVAPAQASASRARIDPLERQLVQKLGPDMAQAALEPLMQNLIAAYNQERGDLARSISEQRIVAGAVDPQLPRQSPCPTRGGGNSGSGRPKFVIGSVSLLDYYPPEQQRDEIEGRVVLRLRVSAGGCMQSSSLRTSSGSPALDDAAAALVEHAHFLPAEADGKPVAASFDMAVRFAQPVTDQAAAKP